MSASPRWIAVAAFALAVVGCDLEYGAATLGDARGSEAHDALPPLYPGASSPHRDTPRGAKIHVVFVNSGQPAAFWTDLVRPFAQAAARDLDVELEYVVTGTNRIRLAEAAMEIAARPRAERPDYAIVDNDRRIGGRLTETFTAVGIPVLVAYNPLRAHQERSRYGTPRQKIPLWIGQVRVDYERAGFDMGQELFAAMGGRFPIPVSLLAMTGGGTSPASTERAAGLERAAADRADVRLQQVVHGHWQEDLAVSQFRGLFRRYPETRLIWTANDPMTLGAEAVAIERGLTPGEDILLVGLNWSAPALERVRDGRWVATVGGHFMLLGFALCYLRDYHDGLDFADAGDGLESRFRMSTVNRGNVDRFLRVFGEQAWDRIDFRKLLKASRPEGERTEPYDFSLEALFRAVDD